MTTEQNAQPAPSSLPTDYVTLIARTLEAGRFEGPFRFVQMARAALRALGTPARPAPHGQPPPPGLVERCAAAIHAVNGARPFDETTPLHQELERRRARACLAAAFERADAATDKAGAALDLGLSPEAEEACAHALYAENEAAAFDIWPEDNHHPDMIEARLIRPDWLGAREDPKRRAYWVRQARAVVAALDASEGRIADVFRREVSAALGVEPGKLCSPQSAVAKIEALKAKADAADASRDSSPDDAAARAVASIEQMHRDDAAAGLGPLPRETFAQRRDREEHEKNERGRLGVLPPEAAAKWRAQFPGVTGCKAGKDGECNWPKCPQERDHEPHTTGRACPLDRLEERDES